MGTGTWILFLEGIGRARNCGGGKIRRRILARVGNGTLLRKTERRSITTRCLAISKAPVERSLCSGIKARNHYLSRTFRKILARPTGGNMNQFIPAKLARAAMAAVASSMRKDAQRRM